MHKAPSVDALGTRWASKTMRTAIVPHTARPSVVRSVDSLLATKLVEKIIVVTTDFPPYVDDLRKYSEVAIVNSPTSRFCKSGDAQPRHIARRTGLVLTSDADIDWSTSGLGEIVAAVEHGDCDFAWVDNIVESEPSPTINTSHRRLGFRVVH